MDKLGIYVVPVAVLLMMAFGVVRRVPVFDTFVEGAKEGLQSCFSILPTLVGLIMAVTMLNASGALELLIKPVSGSGATALLTQIFAKDGPDSFAGRVASVMAGSTETTFYCIAVYYGAVQIKKTRHTIPAALIADLTAFFVAGLAVRLFFGT